MDIDDIRRANLTRQIDKHFGGNRSEFARATGKSPSYINGMFTSTNPRNIATKTARLFEEKLGLNAGELDSIYTGTAKGEAVNVYEYNDQINKEEFIVVNESCLKLSAGNGYTVMQNNNATTQHVFHTSYFLKKGLKPENAMVYPIEGNSMLERLQDGDRVMVDKGRKILQNGKIFAIFYDNDVFIKRIQKNPDSSITLRSDNPDYQSSDRTILEEHIESVEVLGQVVDLIEGKVF